MKVKVRSDIPEGTVGFYEHIRRRPGDVFSLINTNVRRALSAGELRLIEQSKGSDDPEAAANVYESIKDKDGKVAKDFSFRWMLPVGESTPDRITTSQQALDAKSTRIKAEKAGQQALDAGSPGTPGAQNKEVL